MNLQQLFEDAQISIRHGLAPIKVTMLAAAILTVTGVFSVGLFSLLVVGTCLYNAGRRALSMYLELFKTSPTILARDSAVKVRTINTSLRVMEKSAGLAGNPANSRGQGIKVVQATLDFMGGAIEQNTPTSNIS